MSTPTKRRPAVAGPGVGYREHSLRTPAKFITAADIAHARKARRTGSGRWIARCVAHADRTPSMSIAEGKSGPLVHCFAGCSQVEVISALRDLGLWPQPTVDDFRTRCRRDEVDQLWQVALRHLTHGEPLGWPPYARTLPHAGEVWITVGPHAWNAAKSLRGHGRHSLVWRLEAPCNAFRWPVAGRHVRVFDTANDLAPNEAWGEAVQDFAQLLVARWNAAQVDVYGDFEPVRYEPEVDHEA